MGGWAARLAGMLRSSGQAHHPTLPRLTERYCVIYQTLAHPPQLTVAVVS